MCARECPAKVNDVIDGRYRILKQVGSGGMGTVFLAEHTLISRRVAIKVLHEELLADPAVVDGFMQEAKVAGTLGHPNIVESTDMGFVRDHVPYIVFEYLEGTLLTDEIYRVGGIPVRRCLHVVQQIASAVHAAHGAGLIHRDLKSDNIFLTDKGEVFDHVKVLDFGISRFLHRGGDAQRMAGTPEFMAPEQFTSPEAVTPATDIFSLGVILYEMLSARRPFSGADVREVMENVVAHQPAPLPSGVPHALTEVLFGKMLAKHPRDRFQSMTEVEAALETIITHNSSLRMRPMTSSIAPPLTMPDVPAREPSITPPPPAKNRRAVAVAGTVTALAALGLVGWTAMSRSGSERRDEGTSSGALAASPTPGDSAASLPTAAPSAPPPNTAAVAAVPETPAHTTPAVPAPAPTAASEAESDAERDAEINATRTTDPRTKRKTPRASRIGERSPREPDVAADIPPPVASAPAPAPAAPPAEPKPTPAAPSTSSPAVASPAPSTSTSATSAVRPGTMDAAATTAAVRRHLGEIRACHDRARLDQPNMSGKVTLRIVIGPDGSVQRASVSSSTLQSAKAESCMVTAVQGWTFPKPAGGVAATIEYPFVLK